MYVSLRWCLYFVNGYQKTFIACIVIDMNLKILNCDFKGMLILKSDFDSKYCDIKGEVWENSTYIAYRVHIYFLILVFTYLICKI